MKPLSNKSVKLDSISSTHMVDGEKQFLSADANIYTYTLARIHTTNVIERKSWLHLWKQANACRSLSLLKRADEGLPTFNLLMYQ